MNDHEKREYRTVVLAALLHDIGKFMNRADSVRRKHPLFSADYVSQERFKEMAGDWIDIDLLRTLVMRHHEYYGMPEDLLVQGIKDRHIRALAYLISRADSYSSGERVDTEPSELDFRKARLQSIFTKIDIGKGNEVEPLYYNLSELTPAAVFPVPEEELTQLSHHYGRLHSAFGEAIENFKPRNFDGLFNGYLSLFEEFFWCVPSDTRDRYNDISLYDHLSTTSAIAACLYQYHSNDLDEKKITDDRDQKFMLVCGDLSGIQDFIFEIGSTNPKRIGKVLRGRSFYLSLLVEVAALKILRQLDLPLSCRIMNAGGRFTLLVPNTDEVKKALTDLKAEIEEWFYKRFLGKLALNIAHGVTLSRDDFGAGGFVKKYRELSRVVEVVKKRRFNGILAKGTLEEAMRNAFDTLQKDEEACEFCKLYPRAEGKARCFTCVDSEYLGRNLVSKRFLYYYDVEGAGHGVCAMGYTVTFNRNAEHDHVLMEKISDGVDSLPNPGYMKRYVANYIPDVRRGDVDLEEERPRSKETLCSYCGNPCSLEGGEEETTGEVVPPRKELVQDHLTLQCISAYTRKENKGRGADHLAVIKADVDDLGAVFNHGLGEMLTISRYASLSRMINYFFSGWLIDEIRNRYRMTYTVYAGGDDLLLIAPWEKALRLGMELERAFRNYVGGNPNITISMGINLMRPGSPIGLAVEGADKNLDRSKDCFSGKKDGITFFNTTARWKVLPMLVEFMELLNEAFRNDKLKVSASFLYRLLKYHEMYNRYDIYKEIEYLRFHALLARDVRRNIDDEDPDGARIIEALRRLYSVGDEFDDELMRNLKIPVFWTLYKNRGGEG